MKAIENDIIELIRSGIATNKQAMMATLHHPNLVPVENALERMKRKGMIRYNGPTKSWEIKGDSSVQTPSQPSAPPDDAVIGSDDESGRQPPTTSTSENIMNNTNTNENNTSKIDAAINAAKSRKTAKNTEVTSSTPGEKRPKLTAEAKAERELQRETEKQEKKANRDTVRAAKQAQKQADKKPAHMSKVAKAAMKLPALDNNVQQFFNELTVNFTQSQLSALSAHVTHYNRVKATERALKQKVTMGSRVKITGGDNKFIGLEGTVSKAQRIRCYVEVEGIKKPIYLFTSDVDVLDELGQSATG